MNDPLIGRTIDGCAIIRRLGGNTRSLVYEAQHPNGTAFALKFLRPDAPGGDAAVDRFFRQAQALAQVQHPSIVSVQNVGQEGEYYFIRMELLRGETCAAMVDRTQAALSWRDAGALIAEAADALAALHAKGLVHGDVCPQHIMRTMTGVKLIGFWRAKHWSPSPLGRIGAAPPEGDPAWMSPELCGGKPTDPRSDIYSLGVTLYYLLTGVRPFNGKNLQEVFLKHFFYTPESPQIFEPEIPDALAAVVARCLQKKKAERYQDAARIAADLGAVLG